MWEDDLRGDGVILQPSDPSLMDPNSIHGPLGQSKMTKHVDRKYPGMKKMTGANSKKI
jgi:hypothetical protein